MVIDCGFVVLLRESSCLSDLHVVRQFCKHSVRDVVLGTCTNRQTDFAIQ
ncbi:hypothetical protein SynBIOSU31_00058 [Synechococcus sp. BIOS-U3-1]|nr:hypothetical protein SynBIOSU31_00058 [Synechococcus sp. BIOS-U3-1]